MGQNREVDDSKLLYEVDVTIDSHGMFPTRPSKLNRPTRSSSQITQQSIVLGLFLMCRDGDGILLDMFAVDDDNPCLEGLFRGSLVGLEIGPTAFGAC